MYVAAAVGSGSVLTIMPSDDLFVHSVLTVDNTTFRDNLAQGLSLLAIIVSCTRAYAHIRVYASVSTQSF